MKQNSQLRAEARQILEGNWGDAALITVVYLAIAAILGTTFQFTIARFSGSEITAQSGGLFGNLLFLPISYAMIVVFLRLKRGIQINVKDLFAYYNGRVFLTMLLKYVYILLWALLLIIPGIIKSYSYAMTEYIMLDDPEIKNNAAIEKSMQMMQGKKGKLFLLDLSFIGWIILCLLTFGLGFILLEPYMQTARAAFYEDLKAELEPQPVVADEPAQEEQSGYTKSY